MKTAVLLKYLQSGLPLISYAERVSPGLAEQGCDRRAFRVYRVDSVGDCLR
jgi:hypothetical protein